MINTREFQLEVGHEFFAHIARTVEDGFPGEVVMVIPRTDGRVLLMTKAFYPEGVYRLPTGKLNGDEDPEEALSRELYEETGFRREIDRYLGRLDYVFRYGERRAPFLSHVYVLQSVDEAPHSLDTEEQITGFRYVSPDELRAVACQLRSLEQPWEDWGCFRAIAHEIAWKWLMAES